MKQYSEDALIERPAIALFGALGWETVNAFHETYGAGGTLGRETRAEVVLAPRLRAALARLNPGLSPDAIELAVAELARDRGALSAVNANREVYGLLKEGVKVAVQGEEGEETVETVRVVDWREPANNDFLLVSQLWVTGELYTRRADLVGFVNGLPLVLVELKAAHKRLADAYDHNLTDYKATIPQLFWHNALIVLSNGGESRVGSLTAAWEHFGEWKRIAGEGEAGVVSLETVIRGVGDPARLLDLVENFTLFTDAGGATVKLLARNHQYLGVNNALARLREARANGGRLGVFWHTQGSGKSYSMVFLTQKILRTAPGNWTFVIVTDREELDEQIYRTFAHAGAVTEEQVQAGSGAALQRLLREDHRLVFTLIQKFHAPPGTRYPTLSERDDIIVITDEAHRSQYDQFALNMRNALPGAAFLGFTGTPLIAGEEEQTRAVFGEYVSIYNFRQSVEDGATVPLYYENRIPELQLTNAALDDDLARVIEAAALDDAQEARLEREFAREYHLITRGDRLETIAADIVAHFLGRGPGGGGKAMVVAIDKPTAVTMYDKVRAYWDRHLADLQAQRRAATGKARIALDRRIHFLLTTDMAVVVSQEQNEGAKFAKKGLDILPHRRRMAREDLDEKFKDPQDPLRLVFVCAMWMTGFDVPSLTTLYLDKPLRNHTLMQTIARANRVHPGKTHGLIVDYAGVFRDLQRALAIYGVGPSGGGADLPVRDKGELVAALRATLAEAEGFCRDWGIDPDAIGAASAWAKVGLLKEAVEQLLINDETQEGYLALARAVATRYAAILPDAAANEFDARVSLLVVLADQLRASSPRADIDGVLAGIERVLDASIAAEGYVIREAPEGYDATAPAAGLVDLSRIDFAALARQFAQGRKRTEAEKLRGAINGALTRLVRLNKTRVNYLERFQALIDAYNAGSINVEEFFRRLVAFAQALNAEERRAVAAGLSEEELAIFDLLTKPDPSLARKDEERVKQVARDLLAALKREKLILDWRKRQQARAQVRVAIEEALDRGLPEVYGSALYHQKCDAVYQHVFDAYAGAGRGTYTLSV